MSTPRLATLVSAALLASAPLADAQEPEFIREVGDEYHITFDPEHGTALKDFLDMAQGVVGKPLDYDVHSCDAVRLNCRGTKVIPKEKFWSYFQSILRAYDYIVVPYGNISPPGQPVEEPETGLFAIRRASGSQGAKPGYIKSQAPVVLPAELQSFKHDSGMVLTTTFHLQHVNCQEAVNMLQTYFTDPMIESVRAVSSSNSIVATGFAQTLAGLHRLLAQIDVAPGGKEPTMERIPLKHAVAAEVLPIVHEFAGIRTQAAAHNPQRTGALKIEADTRTNALLVLAPPKDVTRIKQYISTLDVAFDPIENTRVHVLKNAVAQEVANTLHQWASVNRLTAQQGARQTQAVTFVADPRSNSLLVTCAPQQWAQLEALISKLDVASEP